MSREESSLFDIDDAFIGDDPDIEVVVDPGQEPIDPHKEQNGALDERKEGSILKSSCFRKQEREKRDTAEEKKRKEQAYTELDSDIEPVTMNHLENLLVLVLSLEVIATKGIVFWHREILERAKWQDISDRDGEKQHGIGKKENGKDDNKKNRTKDGDFLVERVAEEVKHNEERCHEEAHEKHRVEKTKNKLHMFLCLLLTVLYH